MKVKKIDKEPKINEGVSPKSSGQEVTIINTEVSKLRRVNDSLVNELNSLKNIYKTQDTTVRWLMQEIQQVKCEVNNMRQIMDQKNQYIQFDNRGFDTVTSVPPPPIKTDYPYGVNGRLNLPMKDNQDMNRMMEGRVFETRMIDNRQNGYRETDGYVDSRGLNERIVDKRMIDNRTMIPGNRGINENGNGHMDTKILPMLNRGIEQGLMDSYGRNKIDVEYYQGNLPDYVNNSVYINNEFVNTNLYVNNTDGDYKFQGQQFDL